MNGEKMTGSKIKVAIVGVGNCASSLVQGVYFYRAHPKEKVGLMHQELGGYLASDIEFVAAFDVDARKVGKNLSEAIFAKPNSTLIFYQKVPPQNVTVKKGPKLDGVSSHMKGYSKDRLFQYSNKKPVDVVKELKASGAEILLNYLPVGSEKASRYYANACLKAGVAMVNCIPVFIASDSKWGNKFREKGLPICGDDVASQAGATIIHKAIANLLVQRGITIDRMYQLNVGGNTDFLNMLDKTRLESKRISKREAVNAMLSRRLANENIHIGPSDYVPWLNDHKIAYIRIEGRKFGGVPLEIDLKLSVGDSPNSAGSVIDAIRCTKIALERGISGPLIAASAYLMKHPPKHYPPEQAAQLLGDFINGKENI